jgi:hypothetical protein
MTPADKMALPDIPATATLYKLTMGDYWYIGSTSNNIKYRMGVHYNNSLRFPERKLYKQVTGAGGWGNVKCEIVKTVDFTTKADLHKLENEYIRLDDPLCLNMTRATLTEQERVEANREQNRRAYHRKRAEDPEFLEREKARLKEFYAKRKEDPAFMEMKRQSAMASYYRRKAKQEATAACTE